MGEEAVMITKKKFELMHQPVSAIPELRKQVLDWAKRQKYKVVRIHYGVEDTGQMVDVVTVEYERSY